MRVVRFYNKGHPRVGVEFKTGRKKVHILFLSDSGLTVRRLPKAESRYFEQVTFKGEDYPLKRALRLYRGMLRRHGGTKAAKQALGEIAQEAAA